MTAAITEPRAFASLGPMLLARKGTAKPAMRAMLGQADRMAELSDAMADELDELALSQSALGWNDMGENWGESANDDETVVALPIARKRVQPVTASASMAGRKAFTLRLDAERHLKLRLASTMQGASAQTLVTEALDRFLADHPEIEAIAAEMRNGGKQKS